MFRVFIPKSIVALIVGDILLTFACFVAADFITRGESAAIYLLYEDGLLHESLAVLIIILTFYFQNVYTEFRIRSRVDLGQQVVIAIGCALLGQALIAYLNRDLLLPRWVIFIGSGLLLLILPPWRIAYIKVIYKTLGLRRVLFLGTDITGTEVAERISSRPERGLAGIGFVDNQHSKGEVIAGGLTVLGKVEDLPAIVAETRPDTIVVNLAERRNSLPVDLLLDLRFSGVVIEEASTLFETAFGRVTTRRLRPSHLIFSTELGPARWKIRLQTIYSFVVASIGLIVLLPLMLLVALAVKLTSRGPILFSQSRVGLNGKLFTIYKFRSMVEDAEAATGAVWATRNDPRVTSIGGFMRRTRLDELPQLLNVIRGDMAIVGPRPERPEFVNVLSEQIPFYRQRHSVKPGVTGWAQINYKYGETVEDTIIKLEYDLYYIKNLSPSLDVYIIFDTLKVMLFSGHGQ